MEAGRLRHWLTFQQKTNDEDSDENLVEEWIDAFAVSSRMPCEVQPLSGRELMAAAEKRSRVTHRIRTRFRPGFDASMRAVAPDGTIYNLEAVIPDPDSGRRWITFTAYTGTNEG